jgi:mandelate racemase
MTPAALTIRELRLRAVRLPIRRALVTASGSVTAAPFLLLDLSTEEGVSGCAYLFCFHEGAVPIVRAAAGDLAAFVKGKRVEPAALYRQIVQRYRLIGVQGVIALALSGLDVACWDALAKAAGQPLARHLGGALAPVPAYNSCALGIVGPEAAAEEAQALLAEGGFRAVKLRLGRAAPRADLAVVRAVRKAIPADALLMSDYNQALDVTEAIARGRALDGEGLSWIEEPVRHDDYAGNARVAAALATPVQIGENFILPQAMQAALAAGACDYVMPDLQRIGGVTGWLRAAALAEGAGMPMSSHLFPEVSAHLLAVTPTAHWLEYMDWANAILAEPLSIEEGMAVIPERPGHGMAWDEAAVARYAIG